MGDIKHSAKTSAVNDLIFFIFFLRGKKLALKNAESIVSDFIRAVNSGKMERQGIFPINGEMVEKMFRLWYNDL